MVSNLDLYDEALKIALHKKNLEGRNEVFRTTICDIIEYNFKANRIDFNKDLTRKLMEDVANAVGGTYIYDKGCARIEF
jgi:hypothetical protein